MLKLNGFFFTYKLFIQRSFSSMTQKTALLIIAPGSEEMEAVITADTLRRGGVDVTIAGLDTADPIKCSRDVYIKPDKSLSEASALEYDAIILPGGLGGSKAFCDSAKVGELLKSFEENGKVVAAICAAPTALKEHKIFLGKNLTSYPGFGDKLKDSYNYQESTVVVDGNLVTSRGPGTAFQFGLALIEKLVGKSESDKVAKGLLLL